MKTVIITNNSFVNNMYNELYDLDFLDGKSYLDVLMHARELIHKNYELLTHPLSGSVKPGETPYKSLIVKESRTLSISSLTIIEEAIIKATHLIKETVPKQYSQKVLDDFKIIDNSLINSGIESMRQFY